MPLFEFICNNCKEDFEILILDDNKVECLKCKSTNITKKISIFAAKSRSINCSSNSLCNGSKNNTKKCCSGC